MTGRWAVTLLTAAGVLVAGLAAQSAGAPLASLAWALLAGIGLSLMLRGFGLRIVGMLLVALAVGGVVWGVQSAQWVPVAGFAVAGVAALGFVAWGPGWRLRQRREREVQVDYWKAMDEGDDPTDEQGSHPGDKSG